MSRLVVLAAVVGLLLLLRRREPVRQWQVPPESVFGDTARWYQPPAWRDLERVDSV